MTALIILLFPLLAGRSVGSEVDDKTNQTELTASKCLQWKWYCWVSHFDINGDGIISVDDLNKARNNFSQHHNLTGEDKKISEGVFTQWWTWMLLWNKTEVTEEEFLDLQSIAFLDDKENFLEKMWNMSELLVKCHDVDNDGFISKQEETWILRTAILIYNKQDKYFYHDLHPDGWRLNRRTMTLYWVIYFTQDDCTYMT